MSLYNMMFGKNPASGVLLAMLERTEADMGRKGAGRVAGEEGGACG